MCVSPAHGFRDLWLRRSLGPGPARANTPGITHPYNLTRETCCAPPRTLLSTPKATFHPSRSRSTRGSQSEDMDLKTRFANVARKIAENEKKILEEVRGTEGKPVDIGGYYHPDPKLVSNAMRPSTTFNAIIDSMSS